MTSLAAFQVFKMSLTTFLAQLVIEKNLIGFMFFFLFLGKFYYFSYFLILKGNGYAIVLSRKKNIKYTDSYCY